MINESLINVESMISKNEFFDFLKELDTDPLLNARDADPFNANWMKAFNDLYLISISTVNKRIIDSIREKSFKYSFRACNNSEVAGYISDDFELIAKSFLADKSENWAIQTLWNKDQNGLFPC